jgi:hypothetical protein
LRRKEDGLVPPSVTGRTQMRNTRYIFGLIRDLNTVIADLEGVVPRKDIPSDVARAIVFLKSARDNVKQARFLLGLADTRAA